MPLLNASCSKQLLRACSAIVLFSIGGNSSMITCDAAALRKWRAGTDYDRLSRKSDPEPNRRVLLVVGITGAGKSSTSNTLAGRLHKAFATGNTVTSITQAASQRDYDFVNEPFRVIDTPGLCDTTRSAENVRGELIRIANLAPHGVTAFVIVIPRGRFTAEHETALRELDAIFGKDLRKLGVIAMTGATDSTSDARGLLTRDAMVDEINALPLGHYLRKFVEDVSGRVVPVENLFDPHRFISRMSLHQRILDAEASMNGYRYDPTKMLEKDDASTSSPLPNTSIAALAESLNTLTLSGCTHQVIESKGVFTLRIECKLDDK
jgi:hypothetical protein